jgi:sugar phosphate isomerase/epimerase
VSDWIERFRADGFDGIELWENHVVIADASEQERLASAGLPVAVFNTYARFDDTPEAARERETAAQWVERLGARGVKFNVGPDPGLRDAYLFNAADWRFRLPGGTRLLCECHGGTVLETLKAAAAAFAGWNDRRFQAIFHPFASTPGQVQTWLRTLGPGVLTHAHVQMRDAEGPFLRLESRSAFAKEILAALRDEGYAGSFTLEFAEGTRTPDENPEGLYASALRDLRFLRENL